MPRRDSRRHAYAYAVLRGGLRAGASMRGRARDVDVAMKALLGYSSTVHPLPDVVRERVIERARSYVASASESSVSTTPVMSVGPSWQRIAAAAAAFLALVAAGAVAAFRGHVPLEQAIARRSASAAVSLPDARARDVRSISLLPPAEPTIRTTEPRASSPRLRESYAPELRLLGRAHLAYARADYAAALALLLEHSRRFPMGRLAEERDALRVRALVASGRRIEARRAADAFDKRFPRSVLRPRVEETLRVRE
jgi:hypothetical protein